MVKQLAYKVKDLLHDVGNAIEIYLTAVKDPLPSWNVKGRGWVRVCWRCLPVAIGEYDDVKKAPFWSWEMYPLVVYPCDRCGARFRRYAEIIPIEEDVIESWSRMKFVPLELD